MEGSTGNHEDFPIDPANTGPIFTGDPVVISDGAIYPGAAGTIAEITAGGAVDAVPGGGSQGPVVGIFRGVKFVDSNGDIEYRQFWDGLAGRSEIKAQVSRPPHRTFTARMNPATGPYTGAAVGTRVAVTYGAGNPATGDSASYPPPTSNGGFIVNGLADFPGNSWDVEDPIVEVVAVAQALSAADVA
jgi:hypothetical protein